MSTHDGHVSAAMTSAEFRCLREALGLSVSWLSKLLHLDERTVRGIESEKYTVRETTAEALLALQARADAQVADLVAELADVPDPVVEAVPADKEYWVTERENTVVARRQYPAAWQRAVAFRTVQQVPGARIVYPTRGSA